MLTALTVIALLQQPVKPDDGMHLKLNVGDKIAYEVGVRGAGMDAKGRLVLSVTKKAPAGYSLTWPEVAFSGGMTPMPAGACVINDKGRLVGKGKAPDAAMYLVQMALPDGTVKPGDKFKFKYAFGESNMDLDGVLSKLDEGGALAVFVMDGQLATPDGGKIETHQEANFDTKRGLFRSSELKMTPGPITFWMKLQE